MMIQIVRRQGRNGRKSSSKIQINKMQQFTNANNNLEKISPPFSGFLRIFRGNAVWVGRVGVEKQYVYICRILTIRMRMEMDEYKQLDFALLQMNNLRRITTDVRQTDRHLEVPWKKDFGTRCYALTDILIHANMREEIYENIIAT